MRSSRQRLTPPEAQKMAEQDAPTLAPTRPETQGLLDDAGDLIAEIDGLLVERPFLLCFTQWDGE